MLIAPLLAGGLRLRLTTPLVSAPVRPPHGRRDGLVRRRRRAGHRRRDRRARGSLPGHRPDDRARCVLGELPAGDGRRRRRAGPGPRPAPRLGPGRRRLRRPPRRDGVHGRRRRRRARRVPRSGRRAHRHRRRHGRRVRPRADARRRGRRRRRRRRRSPASASSGPRRATASATSPASCGRSGRTSPSSPTGCASSRPARCTAPSWRPTTTTAWRWRSACSGPSSPASRWPIPTSWRRAGRGSGRRATASSTAMTGAAVATGRPATMAAVPAPPTRRDPSSPRSTSTARSRPATASCRSCARVAGTPRIAGGLLRRGGPFVAALARRDRDRVKALASRAAFAGRPIADVEQQGVVVRRRHRRPAPPHRTSPRRLAWHRDAGHTTVLVSASYAVYLRPLATSLGVDGVVATELDVGRGRPLHRAARRRQLPRPGEGRPPARLARRALRRA